MTAQKVGRYELLGEIGRGGMATVHRAFDPNSNREVAIKLLPHEMLHSPEFLSRFQRELRLISSLEHHAIVPIYDSGEDNGQPFFVMRLMHGGTLTARLQEEKLSLQRTAEIIEKIALGLEYAHKKGIIHRDIKPDNILFDGEGNPYISDFGVAKLLEAASSQTGSGVIGTPDYASPEQATGENDKVDHRSDVYGLGVLAYQMLTGEKPFTADTPMKMLVKHITESVPNILDSNSDLPPELETIIKTAMAKKREDRYQSVLDFARALSLAAFGPDRTAPSAFILAQRQHYIASPKKKPSMLIGGVVMGMILGAAAYFTLPIFSPSPTPTNTPVPPTASPTNMASQTPSPTAEFTPTVEPPTATPTFIPTPNGGTDRIALFSGNLIMSMNMDGSDAVVVDSENYDKSNLQWIADGRLVYMSIRRNCAYVVDPKKRETRTVICFNRDEKMEGFRVSPDGETVAISIARTLYLVPFDIDQLEDIKTRFLLERLKPSCTYNHPVKDVLWSKDGKSLAALVLDNQQGNSDQIHVFRVTSLECDSLIPVVTDKFPARLFDFGGNATIPSYDWDGNDLFLLNDFTRNDGFGNLYLYDAEAREGRIVNPIDDGACCYRDARWSADGQYILFLYQNELGREINMYYIPLSGLDTNGTWEPISVGPNVFSNSREKPQPALHPAQ